MEFTAKDVMKLREMSGAGMMDCKKALKECDGDMDKAMDYLREKSLAASAKKAARIAAEGIVDCFVCEKCGVGVIIEVNCETDFVAKTDDFKALVASLAKHVAKMNPADVDEMMAQKLAEDETKTVSDVINGAVAKIGEKKLSKGIRITADDKKIEVEAAINIAYGYQIPKVYADVQDRIKSAVETMTGLTVTSVNVRIASVDME